MHIFERQARETSRDYALRTIKENIVLLELEPGSKISENELAAELGLSRTPVREALIELEKVKIVEIYPQRGSSIALVDYDLVDEAQFMRTTLECAMLERCCERGLTPQQKAILQENLKLQDFYLEQRNHKLFDLDNAFHRYLFDFAQLTQVYTLMNSMTIHLDRVRNMHLIVVKKLRSVEEHHSILDALIRCDAQGAKDIMRKHVTHYQADFAIIQEKYPQYIK